MLSSLSKKFSFLIVLAIAWGPTKAQDSRWFFEEPSPHDVHQFVPIIATSAVRLPSCFFMEGQIYSRKYNHYPGKSTLYNDPINPKTLKDHIIARKNGKYGIVLMDTTEVIPPIYDQLEQIRDKHGIIFIARKGDKWGVIDNKNEVVIPFEFDAIHRNLHDYYDSCTHLRNLLEVRKDNLVGIYMSSGKNLVPCVYNTISDSRGDLSCPLTVEKYKVSLNGKYGYVGNTGEVFIPPKYSKIEVLLHNKNQKQLAYYKVFHEQKVGLLNENGKELIPIKYAALEEVFTDLGLYFVFKENGKYGCLNENGEVLLSPQFSKRTIQDSYDGEVAARFSESADDQHYPAKMSSVQLLENGNFIYRRHGKWGLYSVESDTLYPAKYTRLHPSRGDFLFPEQNGKFGLLKTNGKELASPSYEEQFNIYQLINGGIAVCKRNGKYGIINDQGVEIIPPKYAAEFELPVGYERDKKCFTSFQDGEYFVMISNAGKEVLYSKKVETVRCETYSKYIILTMEGKEFLMSPDFQMLSSRGYDRIEATSSTNSKDYQLSFYAIENGLKGLLDSTGRQHTQCKYNYIDQKSAGNFLLIDSSTLYAYSFKYGKTNIELEGRYLSYFDGLSAISYQDGKFVLLDTANQAVSKRYDKIQSAGPGYFRVLKAGLGYNFINRKGEEQLALHYPKVKYYDGKVGVVKQNGYYGVIDSNENFIVPPTYEKVKGVYDGKICVRKNKKFGVIDFEGNVLMDFVFDVPIDIKTIAKKGIANLWSGNYNYDVDANFNILSPLRRKKDHVLFLWERPYKPVQEFKYHDEKYFLVKQKGKFGLADSSGTILIPVIHDELINELSFYHGNKGENVLSDMLIIRDDTLCAVYHMGTQDLSEFVYRGWRSEFPGELQVLKDRTWIILNKEGKEEKILDY